MKNAIQSIWGKSCQLFPDGVWDPPVRLQQQETIALPTLPTHASAQSTEDSLTSTTNQAAPGETSVTNVSPTAASPTSETSRSTASESSADTATLSTNDPAPPTQLHSSQASRALQLQSTRTPAMASDKTHVSLSLETPSAVDSQKSSILSTASELSNEGLDTALSTLSVVEATFTSILDTAVVSSNRIDASTASQTSDPYVDTSASTNSVGVDDPSAPDPTSTSAPAAVTPVQTALVIATAKTDTSASIASSEGDINESRGSVISIASQPFTRIIQSSGVEVFANARTTFAMSSGGRQVVAESQSMSAGLSDAIIVGSTTLQEDDSATSVTAFEVGGQTYTAVADGSGNDIIDMGSNTITLSPGGSAFIAETKTFSEAADGAIFAAAGSQATTIPLHIEYSTIITIGSKVFTATHDANGDDVLENGSTRISLSAGGPTVTTTPRRSLKLPVVRSSWFQDPKRLPEWQQ
ncbi:hypothetical protein LTR02_017727 [Friedmanniomyces endolithicus]|nr:hypothetical protein LTR02_017727 [Friedmanniomyces endolithicus]